MNLKIHNLGRIKDAELELRPLTVFSGHNGTNKTWVAWAVWEILRRQSTRLPAVPMEGTARVPESFEIHLKSLLQPLTEVLNSPSTSASASLDSALHLLRNDTLEAGLLPDYFVRLFGPQAGIGSSAEASISFHVDEISAKHESIKLHFEPAMGQLSATISWRFPDGTIFEQKKLFVQRDWDEPTLLVSTVALILQPLLTVLCFPADRAGILLATEGGTEIQGVPLPVQAFADAMRVMRTARVASKVGAEILPLLSRIAGGEIRYAGGKGEERLVLDVAGRALPIGVASSLSRSVAGLAQYLRTMANPGDIILIDELEMNAHPAAQLALVELMAVMVSHGIRIVLTTHSPYVIDHLNNLLEAGRAPEERQAKLAEEFQLKTPRAFLTREQVSVYAFEATEDGSEVKVNDAIDRETGLVSNSTFAPVTERLSRIFNAALDASEE